MPTGAAHTAPPALKIAPGHAGVVQRAEHGLGLGDGDRIGRGGAGEMHDDRVRVLVGAGHA